jgi:hypothetical protein
MAGLVEQLQAEALDPTISVSVLLRKAKLAAVKLKLPDAIGWADAELNGYTDNLPAYRVFRGAPKAHNPYVGWVPIMLATEAQEQLSQVSIFDSISTVEAWAASDTDTLTKPLPPQIIHMLNRMNDAEFAVMATHFPRTCMVTIIERVRNLVFDWALELETAGIMGEGLSFSPVEQQRAAAAHISIGTFSGNLHAGDVSGANARSYQGSADNSTNTAGDVFQQVDGAIRSGVADPQLQAELLALVREMRESQKTPAFTAAYQRFVTAAASHMTIVAPFLPALTGLLPG